MLIPYRFDFRRAELVCTESDPSILDKPFLYQAQRGEPQRRIHFRELKPYPGRACLIYSIGRCGSTLIVRALRDLGANAISEPGYFIQAAKFAQAGKVKAPRLVANLISGATSYFGANVTIKLDAWSLFHYALTSGGFDRPLVVIVLRAPVPWAMSAKRFARLSTAPTFARFLSRAIGTIDRIRSIADSLTLYYEDFAKDLGGLTPLTERLGLPSPSGTIIADDVQAGTPMARSRLPAADATFGDEFARVWREQRPANLIAANGLRFL